MRTIIGVFAVTGQSSFARHFHTILYHEPRTEPTVLDFALTESQQMFRDSVAAFARKELSDGALERAHTPHFPHDVAKKMAAAGLLGITLPEADGGSGGTLMDAVLAIQEVAKYCPRSADVIQEGNFGAIRVLAHFATEDQKARYLAPLLRGDEVIAV